MYKCNRCLENKPRDEFYFSSKGYRIPYCKDCNREKAAEWRSRDGNTERSRATAKASYIKKKYGLSRQEYLDLTVNGCAVCGSTEGLAVDHDHSCCPGKDTCGKCIRGPLCRRHNWAAGNLNDSPEEARKLADYLERTRNLY